MDFERKERTVQLPLGDFKKRRKKLILSKETSDYNENQSRKHISEMKPLRFTPNREFLARNLKRVKKKSFTTASVPLELCTLLEEALGEK